MSSPEPEVRPVVHVWLVSMVDLTAEQLGQGEPRAEGPGSAQPHPDHLDVVVIIDIIAIVVLITWIVLFGGGGCVTGGKSTVVTQT